MADEMDMLCSHKSTSFLIATLRTVMRLPFRQIQLYLATLHHVHLSVGELVEVLHRVAEHVEPMVEALKHQVQASPAIQADETGWREDGKNGGCVAKMPML